MKTQNNALQKTSAPLVAKMKPRRTLGRRDRAATENSILNAAHQLFAEKGFENTRTLEIAKLAKANEALINRYFGSKEGLLFAVLESACDDSDLLSNHACPEASLIQGNETSLPEALKEFFKKGKSTAKARESFMRIGISRALLDERMASQMKEQIINARMPMMEEGLSKYLNGGKFSKELIQAFAVLLTSNNFTLNFLGRRVYKMSPQKVDLSIQILVEALSDYAKKSAKKA